jgi:hypothetical protein
MSVFCRTLNQQLKEKHCISMEIRLRITNLAKLPGMQTPQGIKPAVQVQAVVEVHGFVQQPNTNPTIVFVVPVEMGDKLHIDEVFTARIGQHPEHPGA